LNLVFSLISSVQSLSHVGLFATPWTAAHQAFLPITNSQSLLNLMSIESVMPSNHLILCRPLLLLPSIFPGSGSFQMSQFFASGGQSIGVSASASVLPMKVQDWFAVHGVTKSQTWLSNWTELNTVKVFGIVNKAEVDVFLELSCFFYDPADVGNLISGSSAFSKTSLNIWKFMVHVLLKPGLENFEHYFASTWGECNCAVVWAFLWHCLSLGLEWKLTFSSPMTTAEFSKFAAIQSVALSQHYLLGFEIAQLEFHHHIPAVP